MLACNRNWPKLRTLLETRWFFSLQFKFPNHRQMVRCDEGCPAAEESEALQCQLRVEVEVIEVKYRADARGEKSGKN